jgi:hypothetical protein
MGNGGCRECLIAGDARLDDRMSVNTHTFKANHQPANEGMGMKENHKSSNPNLLNSWPASVQTVSHLDSTLNLEWPQPYSKPQQAFESAHPKNLSFSQSAIINYFEEDSRDENSNIINALVHNTQTADLNSCNAKKPAQSMAGEKTGKLKTKYVNYVTTEERRPVFSTSELHLQDYNAKSIR